MDGMLTFACMVCQKRMAVPSEMAGRPVRCPHCREISIAPTNGPSPVDQLVFSKPPEAADSILSEPDQAEDSVIAEGSGPRLSTFSGPGPSTSPTQPTAAQAQAPALAPFPMPEPVSVPVPGTIPNYQPAPALNGYGPPPMIPLPGYGPLSPQQLYFPPPQTPDPDTQHLSTASQVEPTPRRARPSSTPMPMKEIIIGALAMYSLVITIVAIIGWSRTPSPTRPVPDPPKKTTRSSMR